jgi:hypothetical protein
MAIGIHVVRVAFLKVDATGAVLSKEDPDVTLKQQLTGGHDHRIISSAIVPNSTTQPTVKAYLEAEASDDYVLEYMDQNTIITYRRTAAGGFSAP